MKKKCRKKALTDEEKMLAVQEYKTNGNASAIARKYGVARTTFLAWLPLFSDTPISNDIVTQATVKAIEETSQAVVRSIDQATASRQEFFAQQYSNFSEAFTYTLKAITTRVKDKPDGIPTRDLAAIFTALTNFAKEFTPTEEQGTTTINLLQQTVNKQ